MKTRLPLLTIVLATLLSNVLAGDAAELVSALTALKNHLTGAAPLSASEIAVHKLTIDANKNLFDSNRATIVASFDLVNAYDEKIGPLWVAGSPIQSFNRKDVFDTDIHWVVYTVMQTIMDSVYTKQNILGYKDLFNGFKFRSSADFPGAVPSPADPEVIHTATINASFPKTFGRDTMGWTSPARKPTGTYLAPGSVATITVPSSLVGKGYQVRVGCHSIERDELCFVKVQMGYQRSVEHNVGFPN